MLLPLVLAGAWSTWAYPDRIYCLSLSSQAALFRGWSLTVLDLFSSNYIEIIEYFSFYFANVAGRPIKNSRIDVLKTIDGVLR
jgi:hypothetical protein